MIKAAITRNLESRGLTAVPYGGDVTVAYLVAAGNGASTVSINDHFGYGKDFYSLIDKAHKAYTSDTNPGYFEAGTLLIDIIDGREFKLLKRGFATRPVIRDLPTDARTARIQEVVDEILRDVRFAR